MKIAILGDCHFGARNDNPIFHNAFEKFYSNIFFPQLKSNGINTIIQLGDLWDRRKYVNFNTLQLARKYFFDKLSEYDMKMYTIVGNHDSFYKNTLEVNSSGLLLRDYENVEVVENPTTISFDGTDICLIPWICPDNSSECLEEIKNTPAEICAGHFEISGFEMYKGHPSDDGLSTETFSKFDTVFSGHYHHRSTKGNISYLGTPYEMTWQDHGDLKGFHVFDTDNYQLDFVVNPYSVFCRIVYDDKDKEIVDLDALDLNGVFVKVVVVNKTDLYKFDQFLKTLSSKGCVDIKIIEDLTEFQDGELDESIDLEDTQSILSNYIDSLETDIDKDKVKKFMKTLYVEAINADVT